MVAAPAGGERIICYLLFDGYLMGSVTLIVQHVGYRAVFVSTCSRVLKFNILIFLNI